MAVEDSSRADGDGNFGFVADPLSFIAQVQSNLAGYKEGFPVIRELVQNADDGRAERVLLAMMPGLAGCGHPLLEAPSLVLLNDGRFEDADRQAIRRLGLGRKVLDEESIGKFGLGLKSVFHFCEAFFFGASEIEATGERDFLGLLNPWTGLEHRLGVHYDAWNSGWTGRHKKLMLEQLRTLAGNWSRWFFVWLPLRSRDHCPPGGDTPMAITAVFAGDDESEVDRWWPHLGTELSVVFPLLRHLREFRQVRVDALGAAPRQVCWLELDPSARRSRFPGSLNAGQENVLHGLLAVTEAGGGNGHSVRRPFGGAETVLADAEFQTLKRSSHWPRPAIMLLAGDESVQSPDKNVPHGAVYMAIRNAGPGAGKLRVRHSSFLPVGEPFASQRLEIDAEVDLLLHGYYFLPPDRSHVDFGTALVHPQQVANTEELKTSWNHHLYVRGVLPRVPEALARFAESAQWEHGALSALTAAVRSAFYEDLSLVCRFRTWECRLGAGEPAQEVPVAVAGDSASHWVLIPRPSPWEASYSVPQGTEEEVRDTFPGLERLVAEVPVHRPGTPRLSDVPPRAWLSRRELALLLGDDPAEFFDHLDRLGRRRVETTRERAYFLLVEVLSCSVASGGAESQKWIEAWVGGFLRVALARLSYEKARPLAATLGRLARMMSNSELFVADFEGSAGPTGYDVARGLNSLKLRTLVIPGLLLDGSGTLKGDLLSAADAAALLTALAGQGESSVVDGMLEQIALQCGRPRKELWQSHGDLRLFPVVQPDNGRRRATFAELEMSHKARRLFRLAGPRPDLEALLAEALASSGPGVLSMSGPAVHLAYGVEDALAACDPAAVVALLDRKPGLGGAEARGRLAARLTLDPVRPEWRTRLRYLLHGLRDRFDAEGALWLLRPQDSDCSWPGILAAFLQGTGEGWRVLEPAVTAPLSRGATEALGVQAPEERQVLRELLERSRQAAGEPLRVLSAEQREFLMLSVRDDLELQRLAIHDTVDGALITAEGEVWLDVGYPLPESLAAGVVRLRLSGNQEVSRRQRQLLRHLDAGAVIRLALRTEEPAQYWHEILDAWQQSVVTLPQVARDLLFNRPWIPVRLGPPRSPSHLLSLPGLDGVLSPFLDLYGQGYLSVLEVDPAVISHPAWPGLCEAFLPDRASVMDALGLLLADGNVPALGTLALKDLDIGKLAEVVSFMPETLLPCAPLLRAFHRHSSLRDFMSALLQALCRPVPLRRTLDLYRWVAAQHEEKPRSVLEDLACAYLAIAVCENGFRAALGELRLLNRENRWKSAAFLCWETGRAHPESCVSDRMREILELAVDPMEERAVPLATRTVASTRERSLLECLKLVFEGEGWGRCSREVLGGAYAIFAPLDEGVARRAEVLLNSDWVSIALSLSVPSEAKVRFTIPGRTYDFFPFRVEIEVVEGTELEVTSLGGSTLRVRLAGELSDLLLTDTRQKPRFREGFVEWTLRFLSYEPRNLDPEDLHELVWRTVERVIKLCYLHELPDADVNARLKQAREGWEERILKAGQFDLKVAQRLIEENLPFYFRQLPRRKGTAISKEVELFEQLQRKRAEADVTKSPDSRDKLRREAESSLPPVLREIARLVREDSGAQQMLLEMVRTKVGRHFQYGPGSIPFELFQNADDALVELEEMVGPNGLIRCFLVKEESAALTFGHAGRPVNQYRAGDRGDYKDRGYHQDLEKMLVMHGSDKECDDGPLLARTGKFGLGFKSVFLASDVVEVRSGRLNFQVLGGMYPAPLVDCEDEDFDDPFTTKVRLLQPPSARDGWRSSILEEFRRVVPVLLVFSRQVDSLAWETADGLRTHLTWEPRSVLGLEGVSVGSLGAGTEEGLDRGLLLEGAAGHVLLSLGAAGLGWMPSGIPRCWVTTPLQEALPCRFAFNAALEVDIGRHQVASGSRQNERRARDLGLVAGGLLCRLFEASRESGWAALRGALGLHESVSSDEFWAQVWEVMSGATSRPSSDGGDSAAGQLVRHLEKACLEQLTSHLRVIPTGLWGAFSGTTGLQEIAAQVQGLLAREEVFRLAEPLLLRFHEPGRLVHEGVWRVVSRVHSDSQRAAFKTLELLALTAPQERLAPAEAQMLGPVVSQELLRNHEVELHGEVGLLRQALAQLQYLNSVGEWMPGGRLLSREGAGDEPGLCGFAPERLIISRDYQDEGLRVFLEHRTAVAVPTDTLVEWLLEAADLGRRVAALRYVLHGRQGRDMGSALHHRLAGGNVGWLAGCLTKDGLCAFGLSSSEADELLRLLLPRPVGPPPPPPPPPPPVITPIEGLRRLQRWWERHRVTLLERYEESVYPHGALVTDSSASPKEWLVLLSLGALHTMGRQTPGQSRVFLERCDNKGWIDLLVASAERPESFAQILEEYFSQEDEQEYFHWIRYLPSLYQLSRWICEYSAMLQEFDKPGTTQRVRDLLNPRSSKYWQGAGLSAPNLRRTLGIGASFVLRELVRNGVVTNPELHPYCFTPTRKVRHAVELVTGSQVGSGLEASQEIYRVLRRYLDEGEVTFGLSFDLPFRLCKKEKLEQILRGKTGP